MDAGNLFYFGVYADDILARHTDKRIKKVKAALSKKFDIKDKGKLHYFLGMNVIQNEEQVCLDCALRYVAHIILLLSINCMRRFYGNH